MFSIQNLQLKISWQTLVLAVIAIALLMALGLWQLARAEQKAQLNRQLMQRSEAAAVPIEQYFSLSDQSDASLQGQSVTLEGEYVAAKTLIIENQYYRGKVGVEVFTPFRLKERERSLLVSRGWLAQPADVALAIPILPMGPGVKLTATVYQPSLEAFFTAPKPTGSMPIRLHHFDWSVINTLLGPALLPVIARLDEGSPGLLLGHWPSKRFDPSVHRRYALQWFAMALLVLLALLVGGTNIVQLLDRRFNQQR